MNAPVPQIPGYRIIRRIGRGGMGDVWLAKQTKTGLPVALKLAGDRTSEKWRHQSEREAVASLNIHHENVVATLDIGRVDGRPWIAMEYAPGGSLSDRVRDEGPLTEGETIRAGLDAAQGLREAARVGVVHRDVKPANLLLDREDRIKVCDLGLVSQTGDDAASVQMGTPRYMAPEQLTPDGRIDHRTDIYALGLSLYFCSTGEHAVQGRDGGEISRHALNTPLPDPRTLRPDLSEGFVRVLRRMTEKDPDNRYQLWEELIIDLEHIERGESPLGAVIATARRANARRRWLVPVLLPVLIAAVLGVAALAIVPRNEEKPVVADPRESEARGRLIFLEEELARGVDAAGVATGLRELSGRYPGTRAAEQALKRADEIEAAAATDHERELAEIERKIRARISAREFGPARSALDAARLRVSEADRERLDRLAPEISSGAEASRADAESSFVKLLARGDVAGARTVVEGTEDTDLGGLRTWRRGAMERLDQHLSRLDKEAEKRAQVVYARAVRVALSMAAEGKLEEARAVLGPAAAAGGPALGDVPEIDRKILDLVELVQLRLIRLGKDLVGKPVAVVSAGELHVGQLASVMSSGVRLEGGGVALPLMSLDTETARALASGTTDDALAAVALARGDAKDVEFLLRDDDSPLATRIRALAGKAPAPEPAAAATTPREGETPAAAADRLAGAGAHAAAYRLDPKVRERYPDRDPEAAAGLADRALDLYVMSRLVEAIGRFRDAVEKDPFNANIRLSLSRLLLDLANRNRSPVLLARIEQHLDASDAFQPGLPGTKQQRDRLAALRRR